MAVYKRHLNKDYTIMPNHHLRNKDLSLKAKGLLSMMLGLPNDWDYSVNGLVSITKEKRTAVENALNELKESGYVIVRKLLPNETRSGLFEYEYHIYEFPQEIKIQEVDDQEVGNQGVGFLGVDNLGVENQQQLNTNKSITKELNTKDTKENNKRKIESVNMSLGLEFDAVRLFESFWKTYPRKVSKSEAKKEFLKVCKNQGTYNNIMKALTTQIVVYKWTPKNKYCPHARTWLHQERWNDEVEVKRNAANKQDAKSYITVV